MRLRSVQPARPSAGGDASCFLAQPVHTLYSFGSQSVLISCKGRGSCASASFRPFQFCRVEMSISAQPGTQADLPTAGRLVLRWAEYLVLQSNSSNSTGMRRSNQCLSNSVPGRPSVGGRRTTAALHQCHSNLVASAPVGAGPIRLLPSCASHSTSSAGRPSSGGRHTVICLPPGIRTVVGFLVLRVRAFFSKLTTEVFQLQFGNRLSLSGAAKSPTLHSSGPPTAAA